MILAAGALLDYAADAGTAEAERPARAIYQAVMEASADGIRTSDLKGHSSTTEFTDAVIDRVRESLAGADRGDR
jgi:isocitrate dehydrogenase (NAD+)